MFIGCSMPLGARLIWKTSAPQRVKLFFWLVLHNKCWTADRRWRHDLQDDNLCIMCDQMAETLDHIILGCIFSREVWSACLRTLRLHHAISVQEQDVIIWWTASRKRLPKQIYRGFDSLFFIAGCIGGAKARPPWAGGRAHLLVQIEHISSNSQWDLVIIATYHPYSVLFYFKI